MEYLMDFEMHVGGKTLNWSASAAHKLSCTK